MESFGRAQFRRAFNQLFIFESFSKTFFLLFFFVEVKMLAAPTSGGSSAARREKAGGGSASGAKEADANNDDLPLAIQTFLWRQTRFVKMHHRASEAHLVCVRVLLLQCHSSYFTFAAPSSGPSLASFITTPAW